MPFEDSLSIFFINFPQKEQSLRLILLEYDRDGLGFFGCGSFDHFTVILSSFSFVCLIDCQINLLCIPGTNAIARQQRARVSEAVGCYLNFGFASLPAPISVCIARPLVLPSLPRERERKTAALAIPPEEL